MNDAQLTLIPIPAKVDFTGGYRLLSASDSIGYDHPDFRPLAIQLQTLLRPATGFDLPVTDGVNTASIKFELDTSLENKEAYQLVSTNAGITIKAASAAGAFYGIQTLRQLLPPEIESREPKSIEWTIPLVTIADRPRYSYRGMHLDVARHFFSVEFVKRYIDLIAAHKMNVFHWHLTDDQGWRIDIKQLPRLTDVGAWRDQTVIGHTSDRDLTFDSKRHGGYYTQAEIREVVAYAKERFIDVIPEIDIPGHASAILAAYPQFGCVQQDYFVQQQFGIFLDVLCPTEKTFAMLESIFTEVAELFPSPYIHIGGDEVKKTHWESCAICKKTMIENNLANVNELQSYFVRRVEKIVNRLDKKIIGWDEILDGGIDPTATIMSWRGMEGGIQAAKQGHDVIMTPVDTVYFDFYQSTSLDEPRAIHGHTPIQKTYAFEPTPASLTEHQAKHILGAQGNVWTEYMTDEHQVEYMLLPRMSALAEVLWSPKSLRDWSSFNRRLPQLFRRFDIMGIKAARSVYKPFAETKLSDDNQLLVNLESYQENVSIHYTLDGSQANASSPLYEKSLVISKDTIINATSVDKTNGLGYGEETVSLTVNKALGKNLVFHTADGSTQLKEFNGELLNNGVLARDRIFQYHEWTAVTENGLQVVVDLNDLIDVSTVSLGYGTDLHRRLYFPSGFSISTSVNSKDWKRLQSANKQDIIDAGNSIELIFPAQQARFVKIVIENDNRAYSAESRQETSMPVYIDEIVIH